MSIDRKRFEELRAPLSPEGKTVLDSILWDIDTPAAYPETAVHLLPQPDKERIALIIRELTGEYERSNEEILDEIVNAWAGGK